jgi:hypothetical protein
MLFQIPTITFTNPAMESTGNFGTYLLVSLGFFALLYVALLILRVVLHKKSALESSFKKQVLLVLVPKDAGTVGKTSEETLTKTHEIIGIAETLFSALGGLKSEGGFKTWLYGARQTFSFEMVAENGMISFYVACPPEKRDFIEEQIHAQYPFAQIGDVEDYNIFKAQGAAAGAYLVFKRPSAFPIKTYKNAEGDPLNVLTNTLSKIPATDGAAIQIVARSARPSWRSLSRKITSGMQQGKKLKDILGGGIGSRILKVLFSFFEAASKKEEGMNSEKPKELTPLEHEMVKHIEEKASKAGIDVNIRLVATSQTYDTAKAHLGNLINAFGQYSIYDYGNAFTKITGDENRLMSAFIHRDLNEKRKLVLNTEELTSLFHFPLGTTDAPNIKWLNARSAEPPQDLPQDGVIIGRNLYRGKETIIRLSREARKRHMYVIGQTGTGKSTFLQELAKQDIKNGDGICVIDPHGDLIEDIMKVVPKERIDDVVYFDPSDMARPMGLNLLEFDPKYPEQKTFVINELISIFDKLFDLKSTGGPMFEQYLRNAALLIMEHPESGSTLMEIPKVLADAEFRKFKLTHCQNPVVKDFWTKEAEKAGGEAALANIVPYVTSKLTPFIANDTMRPIISQQESSFNIREIMDKKKILFLNLSKGKLGDLNAYLLGMVLVGKIWAAALSRADAPAESRHDFYLYIDEFQNFTTDTIAAILSEARKYGLFLNVGHQYIAQLSKANDTKIRDAVFGNVGTQIAFRISSDDAEFMEKQYSPVFNAHDLVNLSNFNAYVKMETKGTVARPFNIEIYRHWDPWHEEAKSWFAAPQDAKIPEAIKQISRLQYGRDRAEVEEDIANRAKVMVKEEEEDIEEDEEGEEDK